MVKKITNNSTYLYLLYILFTIFIIILLLFYYKSYEYYDSSSQPINGTFTLSNNTIYRNILDEEGNNNQIYYQKGIGSQSSKGTIKFTQPFSQNPFVFTQVNGTPDSEDNLYSVTVSNITPNSFDYYKNVVSNNIAPQEEEQGESAVVAKLSNDDIKSFNWIAFQ